MRNLDKEEKETAKYLILYSKSVEEDMVNFVRGVLDKPDLDYVSIVDTMDYYEVLVNGVPVRRALKALDTAIGHLKQYSKAPRRLIDCITNNPDREG